MLFIGAACPDSVIGAVASFFTPKRFFGDRRASPFGGVCRLLGAGKVLFE